MQDDELDEGGAVDENDQELPDTADFDLSQTTSNFGRSKRGGFYSRRDLQTQTQFTWSEMIVGVIFTLTQTLAAVLLVERYRRHLRDQRQRRRQAEEQVAGRADVQGDGVQQAAGNNG